MSTIEPDHDADARATSAGRIRHVPAGTAAELRNADRAEGHDRRARADRGGRDHDLPGLAHDRRGHAGAGRRQRLAVGSGARGHHPGDPGARPRHRGRRRQGRGASRARRPAWPRCGPIPRTNRRACSSPGSAPGSRSTTCRCRASSSCASPATRRPISRNCARPWPSRSRPRRSTIIAASSIACARWRRPRSPPGSAC